MIVQHFFSGDNKICTFKKDSLYKHYECYIFICINSSHFGLLFAGPVSQKAGNGQKKAKIKTSNLILKSGHRIIKNISKMEPVYHRIFSQELKFHFIYGNNIVQFYLIRGKSLYSGFFSVHCELILAGFTVINKHRFAQ